MRQSDMPPLLMAQAIDNASETKIALFALRGPERAGARFWTRTS